uniref:Dynein axonemal assembly factor 9 n=1 Tax=Lates calcarifer TaxID=8187 RepID=A0A4W6BWX1_LATCA
MTEIYPVQSLLCEGGATTPDGILCSLGIDSRYNDGCTELAKYLFYGLYGRNQLNLDHVLDEFPEEMLDDVILLIKAECVHLYCNPLNYSYLLPYVSHWRNLHLYCMTEAEYEDEEAAEEFKISSFVTMVQDCYRIGVPYSSQGHVQKFDMFMVEKWPLIQAFALEGIGGGSFFTIKYKLMDMSEKLWQVYTRLDPVSLDSLLSVGLGLHKVYSINPQAFRTYYSHGLISSNITDKSKSRQPFVLFGKHSSAEDLESYSFNFPSESHQVRNTGPQGSTARHMVLQCVAPKGPLACSRTYFFGNTHSPYLGNQNTEQKKTEVLLLSQIYSAAVQAVLSGIKCYSCSSSATKAKDVAENTFLVALDSMNLSQYRSFLRIIPLTDEDSRYVVKTASMTVHDIPDLQGDRGDLGSVVFSESFLESSINIQQKDGTVSSDSCYTILTTTVPRYACWLVCVEQNFYFILMSKSGSEGTCLGTALTAADAAYVFSSSQLSTPEEGKIIFFSEGLLFIHSQYGSITLSKNHINTLKFYDPDSSTVASLFVEYESSLLPHLPFPLHSSDQCLVFALQPRSKSHRAFYSKHALWSITAQVHNQSQNTFMSSHASELYPRTDCCILSLTRFLQHFALSSISPEPILYDHLGVLFPSAELKNPINGQRDKVVITIITGLPGSHKKRLCNFLVQLNKERGRYKWVVYEPGPDSCDSFSASHLQQYLSSFLESQRGPGGKPRLLVLSPGGYTDIVFSGKRASFSWNSYSLFVPRCMSGIVSTVVFTGLTAEQKHPLMQHVQQLVRSANPTAAFILAERGAVTRNEDVNLILSESSFNEPQMLRARYVLYPGWCKGRFFSGSGSLVLSQQRVAFNRPLERPLFVTHCKALKSSLRPSPFRGNVYNVWGKVRFSDSEQLMEVSYNTVSGSLSIVSEQSIDPLTLRPKETNTSCFLIFDGIGLTEDGLKELAQTVHQMTRHLDPLPPGYFYNGYQYVDIFGEKRNFHPNMEEFIKEYIAEANKEIELFNRQLELQGQPDLFDP